MATVVAVTVLGLIGGLCGFLVARRAPPLTSDDSRAQIVDRIDALLPQTQCRQCGFTGCRPYAEALARGAAAINRCPPGGAAAIGALADMLGCDVLPLDPTCGPETPPQVAVIDEQTCIGCTKCIQACPVDAIIGAPQVMHTVLSVHCTGCELCLPPCPVDCIDLVPPPAKRTWRWSRPGAG